MELNLFEKVILTYLIIINIISFLAMGIDKYKAIKNKWRIPEKTLFTLAILGGSTGSIIGMNMFRHKTKHTSFLVGMPVILFIQICLFIFLRFLLN